MEMARARLAPTPRLRGPDRPDALQVAAIIDGLWSIAIPSDRLEHIHAKVGVTEVDLTFFFLPAPVPCVDRATRICRTGIDQLPPLRGWLINPAAYEPSLN